MINALKRRNKILFCGNGGSAADSQHLTAELIGQFLKKESNSSNFIDHEHLYDYISCQ